MQKHATCVKLARDSKERQLRKKRGGYNARYHIDRWLVRLGLLLTGFGTYKLYF